MPDKKIHEFDAAGSAAQTDLFIVGNPTTGKLSKITTANVATSIANFADSAATIAGTANDKTVTPAGLASTIPVFNVKADGAGGVGGSDAAAINATIARANVAGRGVVFFPPGSYGVGAPLTTITSSDVHVVGSGMQSSYLKVTANLGGPLIKFQGSTGGSNHARRGSVQGLTVWGQGRTFSGTAAFHLQCVDTMTFRDVQVLSLDGRALLTEETWDSYFWGCQFAGCGSTGVPTVELKATTPSNVTTNTNGCHFISCFLSEYEDVGLLLADQSIRNKFVACKIHGKVAGPAAVNDVELTGAQENVFVGTHVPFAGLTCVKIVAGTNNTGRGNQFIGGVFEGHIDAGFDIATVRNKFIGVRVGSSRSGIGGTVSAVVRNGFTDNQWIGNDTAGTVDDENASLLGFRSDVRNARVNGTVFGIDFANATDNAIAVRRSVDTVNRWAVRADGLHLWSSGSAGSDTTLGRGTANRLDVGAGDTLRFDTGQVNGTAGAGYMEYLAEQSSDPSAPAANGARVFIKDNGSGKTQLCVRFATGATQVIATEP